ncbi:MAG: imidazoleglycerol-phosphate dehydratase [Eubacteriales bacterium]
MRIADIERKTKETDIKLHLNIDGKGDSKISTGIGFFDHMLESFARHGQFDLNIDCTGDLHVDYHHTVEDVGIVLGQAFDKAINDKKGIKRFGYACTPMDETLSIIKTELTGADIFLSNENNMISSTLDISGRPFLVFNAEFKNEMVGSFPTELVSEFLRSFAMNGKLTLHVNVPYGSNTHHIIEVIFKGLGRALKDAATINGDAILSTKGSI